MEALSPTCCAPAAVTASARARLHLARVGIATYGTTPASDDYAVRAHLAKQKVEDAEDLVRRLMTGLRDRVFEAKPQHDRCSRCDAPAMCAERAG